jgi:hypothetical protein
MIGRRSLKIGEMIEGFWMRSCIIVGMLLVKMLFVTLLKAYRWLLERELCGLSGGLTFLNKKKRTCRMETFSVGKKIEVLEITYQILLPNVDKKHPKVQNETDFAKTSKLKRLRLDKQNYCSRVDQIAD